MADAEVLHAAIVTLLAGVDFDVHEAQVPGRAELPWILALISLPGVSQRSLARTPQANKCTVRLTLAGENDTAVRQMWDLVRPAVEGKRPVAAGWSTTGLELQGDPRVEPDPDPTIAETDTRPVVGYTEWSFTATPTA